MKLIIIEGSAYKVSEKEFTKIKKLENELTTESATADYKIYNEAESVLGNYLDENKHKYKYVDEIWFHHQR